MGNKLQMIFFSLCASVTVAAVQLAVPAAAATEPTVPAEPLNQIAAVVNEDVVTTHDLEMRMRMTLLSSGLENTPEVRQRIMPQVLRKLIDEKLQLQEARRLKIEVAEEEIRSGIASIEQQNGMPPGGLRQLLDANGIDIASVRHQVRAEIAWAKAISARVRASVVVGKQEAEDRLAELKAIQGRPEYLLAEIFLPVDERSSEAETQQLAQHMLVRLRDGLPFQALAHQFSRSPTAAAGGDMGWVPETELEDEVLETVGRLQPGQVALVRQDEGYRLMLLRDRRILGADGLPTRDELRQRLEQAQLELAARRYLRNLRRSAVVDIRQ